MGSLFEGDGLRPIYRLQKLFFDEYGSPDRRVKHFEKVTRFRVDVCGNMNGADGHPLSCVCSIWVRVNTDSEITVSFGGSLPLDGAVKAWIDAAGKDTVQKLAPSVLILSLHPGDQAKLASLATAMRERAASHQPYQAAAHGNSAREIAQGLEHLQTVLEKVWKHSNRSIGV